MQSLLYAKASDGVAPASLMTVTNARSAGASTILVNTVANASTYFKGSMGTPHTFTDPVTGETITVISEATAVDFSGQIVSGHVEIVSIDPGYTDHGSSVGDIIVIRPTTDYANNMYNVLNQSHKDDGTFKDDSISSEAMFADTVDPVLRAQDMMFDFIASGAVLAGLGYGSTLTASLTSGVCYINGRRQLIAAIATRTYTANKDTYVDLLYNSSGTATVVYTEVANNAGSPVLAANSIRLGIVVTGANIANVGSINQGQENKVLPIASSVPYTVTDSLGNLICPRDPSRRILGYRRITSTFSTTSGSAVQVTGVSVPVIIPTGRKVKLTAFSLGSSNSTAGLYALTTIWRGTVSSGVQLAQSNNLNPSATREINVALGALDSGSVGSTTYNLGLAQGGGGTASLLATSDSPIFLMVELV